MIRTLAPLTLATCLACNGHLDVFQLDAGSDAGSTPPDTGEQIGVTVVPADILFVVDNSGSMADEQDNLAINFDSFVDQTIGAADYRIGVVTTDMSSPEGELDGHVTSQFSSTYPNALTEFSANCAPIGIDHGCFRGPDPSTRLIDSSRMTRQQQIDAFADNVRVGACGSGNERGLDAMIAALDKTGPGECNEGFLRPDANLVIVLVSDEEEAGATPVEDVVDALGAFKPFGQIRVATVVGSIGGEPSACRIGLGAACGSLCEDPPPSGSQQQCSRPLDCPSDETCVNGYCDNPALQYWSACHSCSFYDTPDCCGADAGSRYIQFARAVETRVHAARPEFPIAHCVGLGSRAACLAETICQASFGDTLARIARELVLVEP